MVMSSAGAARPLKSLWLTLTPVQDEDGGLGSRSPALVSTDPVQAPGRSLDVIRLHLWDHGHCLIRLNELDRASRAADNRLEVLFCSAHLQERHTPLARMACQLASMSSALAHGLDLSICGARIHNDHPLTLALPSGAEGGLPLICLVVVQHRHSCDEFSARLLRVALVVLARDAGSICSDQQGCGSKAARQSHHDASG